MDTAAILGLVKARLGISSATRDTYLTAIIEGVVKELEDEKELVLDGANSYHLIFVVDYVTWRYQSRDSNSGMPRHLQFRLHNLIIHVGSTNLVVDNISMADTLPALPVENTVYILPDDSRQMYINSVWTIVSLINGVWVVTV